MAQLNRLLLLLVALGALASLLPSTNSFPAPDDEESTQSNEWLDEESENDIPEDEEADEEFADYFSEDENEEDGLVGAAPASYNAVDEGLVSPVKSHGSCITNAPVFATTAALEACTAKVTGKVPNYSEQQLLDCAPFGSGIDSTCAPPALQAHVFLNWVTKNQVNLRTAAKYPIRAANTTRSNNSTSCTNKGGKPVVKIVKTVFTTSQGREKRLQKLVAKQGVVITTVRSNPAFENYSGGVFSGCPTGAKKDKSFLPNLVVAVVGYGTDAESKKDFWLVKGSQGTGWGEQGFMRIERGVGMCGIGKALAAAKCAPLADCSAGSDNCEYDEEDEEDEEE